MGGKRYRRLPSAMRIMSAEVLHAGAEENFNLSVEEVLSVGCHWRSTLCAN